MQIPHSAVLFVTIGHDEFERWATVTVGVALLPIMFFGWRRWIRAISRALPTCTAWTVDDHNRGFQYENEAGSCLQILFQEKPMQGPSKLTWAYLAGKSGTRTRPVVHFVHSLPNFACTLPPPASKCLDQNWIPISLLSAIFNLPHTHTP